MKNLTYWLCLAVAGIGFIILMFFAGCVKTKTLLLPYTPNLNDRTFIGAGQSNMQQLDLSTVFLHSKNIAVGGTTIYRWSKGQGCCGSPSLYDILLQNIEQSENPVLLWWQGETDAIYYPDTDWRSAFQAIVSNLRADSGKYFTVIYVQIGHLEPPQPTAPDGVGWINISRQQAAMDGWDGMYMVSIKDLYPGPDGIHYTDPAVHRIILDRIVDRYIHRDTL